ncbi:MAG: CoB--CoM heterodisulfide reductase iron-sulfur subunit B family protein [Bacteroidaceae bacterium]|nr:CoB--CoM heterodisulfide reductase iron-sulfur subunit B family protein [Bacteroidaceae bacterium]
MTYPYFPGCTLKTKGAELDACGRKAAEALGFPLEEIPDWQCCGAVYPLAKDEIATRLSSVRALAASREQGGKLVTLCSACYHVLKRVNGDMRNDDDIRRKVNNYLELELPYFGETKVLHYLEVLRDTVGWDELKKKVTKPLTGRKIGAYYGCLLLRPSRELGFDDPENPSIIEDFIRAIGAEPVIYAMRNECCGGYTTMENNTYAAKQAQKIVDNARNCGAEMLITACPLCMYNLTKNTDGSVPVKYFTELLAEALGLEEQNG